MPKAQETVLEINLNSLKHNFDFLKSKLSDQTKFMAVVKAFGYGHEASEIALYLQDLGVDYFAVAYTNEGVALRDAGIKTPILVLHPLPLHFNTIIERCLEPNLYNARVLRAFIEASESLNQVDYPVHIKFNTGLNRLGFWESDVAYIVDKLNKTSSIKVESIFSHLAASEDLDEKEFTLKQIETFNKISQDILSKLPLKPMLHLCNTSGVLNYPEGHLDMVRSGIGLYGFGNSPSENKNLIPIATLKSVISQIHMIEPNESVGYNRTFKSSGYSKTATIPIGHADGVSRQYGNEKGYVFVNNQKANIIGNVCMDMLMIDITNIECQEGDEVIVFGEDNTAEDLASTTQTISYELLTAVSQRVKRKIIR